MAGKNMDPWPLVRKRAKCCSCGGSLKDSTHLNLVSLNKLARWKHPTWGNVLVPGSWGRACAVVCDQCVVEAKIQGRFNVKYAIEWNNDYTKFKYHPIEDLSDTYPITEEMVRRGEA